MTLERPKRKWEDNTKWIAQKNVFWYGLDLIGAVGISVHGRKCVDAIRTVILKYPGTCTYVLGFLYHHFY